ncbi:MAG: hypothetical protein HZC05_04175 [Candidatus Magasanikbacteria bacterium]|nr:hypothetical protein [Candidatus Magasanikbacteria bacterium]
MKNHREAGSGVETNLPDIVLKDDDGNEFKLSENLMGKRLPLAGIVDEHNYDLIMALRKKWLDYDGNITEAGQKEEKRRAKAAVEAGWENRKDPITEARKGFLRTIIEKLGDPKERVRTALAKYGYTGDWDLKKSNGGGNYTLKFFNTEGQAEEDKFFVGNMSRILNDIDQHVGRISK